MVYGEDSPSYDVVKHWHRQLKCSHTSVDTVPILGQPQSAIDDATIQQIETTILKDCHESELQLVRKLRISFGSVEKIIYDQMQM